METSTFTDTHVPVPSAKPYEEVVKKLESVLGEGESRSFAEMVEAAGTWEGLVRETEQRVGESGFVIFTQIDHGAWMSLVPQRTLFDSAMGCAVHTMLPADVGYTTVELKVNFLRPITLQTGRLRCEGTTIHVGGHIATAEARLLDTSGKLYGHATTTCMIFRNLAPEQSKPSAGEGGI